jgi:multiple antibiotic resistance protein
VLLLLALHMLVSPGKDEHEKRSSGRTPMQKALYPLAVPYLLNPAGIAALVIASGDLDSLTMVVILVILVLIVGAIDYAIFHYIDKLARHLDPSCLAVTEAVFGVLLAAPAAQLMVDGLVELGIIAAIAH